MQIKDFILKQYNTVCFDLDGTILTDDKIITDETATILKELNSYGVEIIIATGRSIKKSEEFLKKFQFPYTIIGNNGAIAIESEHKKAKFTVPLDIKYFYKIREISSRMGIYPYLHIYDEENKYGLIIEDGLNKKDFLGSVTNESEILYINEADKKHFNSILSVVFVDKIESINEICRQVNNQSLKLTNHTIYASSKINVMTEFLNENATKAKGIEKILNLKNKSWNNVIAFGDDNNDLSMITSSKLGISMINGSTFLKYNANKITEYDNNSNGVIKELKKIYGGIYEKP